MPARGMNRPRWLSNPSHLPATNPQPPTPNTKLQPQISTFRVSPPRLFRLVQWVGRFAGHEA